MTSYTVRVELHGVDEGNRYEKLHEEMAKEGFTKTIYIDGGYRDLPTAEYSLKAENTTAAKVLNKAIAAANKVQPEPRPSIIVTETDKPRETYGLRPSK